MNEDQFLISLAQNAPPSGLPLPLQALWLERRGDWERAHQVAQDDASRDGSWVHAYLHRREGDAANAAYWYARAGREFPLLEPEDEWTAMVGHFFHQSRSGGGR